MTRPNVRWLVVLALGAVALSAVAIAPRFLRSHRSRSPAVTAPATLCHDVTPDLDSWIHPFDASHHLVARELVTRMMERPMDFGRAARLVPSIREGRPEGFKLYAIVPGSVIARLGFENGDSLIAINGFHLTDAEKALEVYTSLRAAKNFDISIIRKGEAMQLAIAVE